MMEKKSGAIKNFILLLVLGVIIAVPLVLYKGAQFTGTDDKAGDMITQISPGYKPWFKPVFQPGSDGVENALFILQAGIGLSFIGYYIFWIYKRRKARD